MRLQRVIIVCLFTGFSQSLRASAVAAGPTEGLRAEVRLALEGYERAVSRHSRWTIKLQMTGEATEPDKPAAEATTPVTIDWLYHKDGQRAAVRTIRRTNGKVVSAYRSVIDGWFLVAPLPPPGQEAVTAQFGGDGALRRGAAIPQALPALEGYAAADYLSFVQIIRSANSVSSGRDRVDGHDCIMVHAVSGDHGDYRIWFDPEIGYYPRKIIVQKSGDNYWSGRRLSDWKNFASAKTGGPVGTRYISFSMDRASFDRVEGEWFPSECRISRIQVLEDGSSHKMTGIGRRLAVNLHPLFANEFVPGIREGARLSNLENPQIPYCWQNGKPAPLVDKATLDHMEKTAEQLRRDTGRQTEDAR